MTVINKEDFEDPVWFRLYMIIKNNHVSTDSTRKILMEHKYDPNFVEEATHFAVLWDWEPLYVSYDVSSQYHDDYSTMVSIERICIYDTMYDYMVSRLRCLHSSKCVEGLYLN